MIIRIKHGNRFFFFLLGLTSNPSYNDDVTACTLSTVSLCVLTFNRVTRIRMHSVTIRTVQTYPLSKQIDTLMTNQPITACFEISETSQHHFLVLFLYRSLWRPLVYVKVYYCNYYHNCFIFFLVTVLNRHTHKKTP